MAERLEAIVSRYSKQHYEDVAKVLKENRAWARQMDSTHGRAVMASTIGQFADLFAADNPPSTHCWHCGSNRNVVTDCTHVEHNYGGFDREQFLAACGLEPMQQASSSTVPKQILEHYGLKTKPKDAHLVKGDS